MSYYSTILASNPVAYYRLNEASGTVAHDASGNGYHATVSGATLSQPGAIGNDLDTSMFFTASGGVTLPNSLNVTTFSACSIEYWISIGAGWQYVCMTTDAVSTLLYQNGSLVPSNPTTSSNTIYIDQIFDFTGSRTTSGGLDEIAIYNSKLSASTIYGHYLAASAAVSTQSFLLNKFQVVKVYDTNGNFIDVIRDAPYLSGYKEQINAAADNVKLVLPRPVDAYDGSYQPGSKNTIVLGNNVQWWLYGLGLPSGGLLRYSGVIDTVTPKIDENGSETVEIVVTPYSQLVLGDHGITSTVTYGTAGSSGTYVDTGAIFSSFFTGSYANSSGATVSTIDAITGNPYCYPYTIDPTSSVATGQKTQFAFQNQNMSSAIQNILALSPSNYYFRMNQDQTVYFGKVPANPTYILRLGQHITSLQYNVDNVPRKNVIFVQGKGVSAKYVGSSVSTIGQRVYYKSDNRITDVNTAQTLANGLGAIYDQQFVRATVKIPDYRGDGYPGIGFDIEQFQVGQTVKIEDMRASGAAISGAGAVWGSLIWGDSKWGSPGAQNTLWGSFNWGGSVWGANVGSIFNVVVPIMSIQYDYWSVTLELGFRQPTLNRKLFDLEARFADATLVS